MISLLVAVHNDFNINNLVKNDDDMLIDKQAFRRAYQDTINFYKKLTPLS